MAFSSADAGKSTGEEWPLRRVADLVRDAWGAGGTVEDLPGDRDRNALLTREDGSRYVIKVAPPGEDEALLAAQGRVLDSLQERGGPFRFPEHVPALDGRTVVPAPGSDGPRLTRLLRYVPGTSLAAVTPQTPELLEDVGRLLGAVSATLAGMDEPATHRDLEWDLRRGAEVVKADLEAVPDGPRRARLASVLELYRERVAPVEGRLRQGLVHGDGNDHNVLVSELAGDPLAVRRVVGLIDFGDLVHGWVCGEAAVGAAYAMLDKQAPLDAAVRVVRGYTSRHALSEDEADVLFSLICLRLAVSVTRAARRRAEGVEDPYAYVSEAPAWDLLEGLAAGSADLARYRLREACGLEPCPSSSRVTGWLAAHAEDVGAVFERDPRAVRRCSLDLSVGSLDLAGLRGRNDAGAWQSVISDRMAEADAELGVGFWDEARRWYQGDLYRVETDQGPAWRTVHVGVDLFAEPGTPVLAPLPGTVESVALNDGPLDYGPTVILRHDAGGVTFHTLYGHLATDTLDRLRAGQVVARGDVVGRIGHAGENGGWAPHLHLQIVTDLLDFRQQFPGVALPDQRAVWRSLSPDPNLLLRLPEGCAAPAPPTAESLLEERRQILGPNLSVSYRHPLHVVRGWKQHLYDARGQPYLDCVNNVAHVGHAHPRVVEALHRQAAVLNTNTRYLHRGILAYARRLVALLPDPLGVCFLVCSGSEANELALRLARAHTGRRDVVVLEGGYHGNTSSLVELSPYKFDGPGGPGRPPWVHVAAMPDPYRGRHPGPDGGAAYAEDVARACGDAARDSDGAAAFLAEAILSCGGQVEPPPGYLAEAFRRAREAGAVCVADEVQVGLGRVGSHWWAFEAQRVVPDIVTLGKPLGNGHPLAAVVTTAEIARSFDTGMEYFNTFGGNPPSCAVGMAVLDVMEEEGLRERAGVVGGRLRAGLAGLMESHDLVGDVRGRGLFLGVELVLDRRERTPAPHHAAYVVERARELGVLLSADGPDRNVIKIKPPVVFTEEDADRLVATLGRVLEEDPARL